MRSAIGLAVLTLAACAPRHALQPMVVLRPEQPCAGRARVDHAICAVQHSIRRAYDERDVVKLLCLRSKESALEDLALARNKADDEGHRAELDAEAARLELEAKYCVGEDAVSPAR